MRRKHVAIATIAIAWLAAAAPMDPIALTPGQYAITYRLELPHLERYSVERTETRCIDTAAERLPVLGAKSTFDGCDASPARQDGPSRRYSIACKGRAGARAEARHRLSADGYTGRIAIILGAKNMTMIEVQSARRLGDCAQ